MGSPRVTVLMAVHDGAAVVGRAIESILSQEFEDFELLIVDDGSTDDTLDVLRTTTDPRLRILPVTHRGLAAALNVGLAEARGRLVARQDDDDVSLPERLGRQVERFREDPDLVLVGSDFEFSTLDGERLRLGEPPRNDLRIAWTLLFRNVFSHGSAMFSREAVRSLGGYRQLRRSQDYDLWCRLSRAGRVGVAPGVLYRWTQDPEGLSGPAGRLLQDRIAREVSVEAIANTLGEALPTDLGGALHSLGNGREWEVPRALARTCVANLYRLRRGILEWRPFPADDRRWLDAEVRRRVARLIVGIGRKAFLTGVRAFLADPGLGLPIVKEIARPVLRPGEAGIPPGQGPSDRPTTSR